MKTKGWKKALQEDPIPPWALKAALAHLMATGVIETTTSSKGHTWLADAVGVHHGTVWRWTQGRSALQKFAAKAVRETIFENLT